MDVPHTNSQWAYYLKFGVLVELGADFHSVEVSLHCVVTGHQSVNDPHLGWQLQGYRILEDIIRQCYNYIEHWKTLLDVIYRTLEDIIRQCYRILHQTYCFMCPTFWVFASPH